MIGLARRRTWSRDGVPKRCGKLIHAKRGVIHWTSWALQHPSCKKSTSRQVIHWSAPIPTTKQGRFSEGHHRERVSPVVRALLSAFSCLLESSLYNSFAAYCKAS